MNCLMYLRKLKVFLVEVFFKIFEMFFSHPHPKISILIPFSSKDPIRKRNFKWLLAYWRCSLPNAEVIVGHSYSKIFCKGEALNNAASRARGRVFVILDADAYLDPKVIERCANRIIEEQELGYNLWYVPYRSLYRLTKEASDRLREYEPCDAPILTIPPKEDVENAGHSLRYGHMYGAMIMIFPAVAFQLLGCFDERFKGWGGEDVALLRMLDTLFGKHKTTKNSIFHLWHPYIGGNYQSRRWNGQEKGSSNSKLNMRYHKATRSPSLMNQISNESRNYKHVKDRDLLD